MPYYRCSWDFDGEIKRVRDPLNILLDGKDSHHSGICSKDNHFFRKTKDFSKE
jgi:hypothetical protein